LDGTVPTLGLLGLTIPKGVATEKHWQQIVRAHGVAEEHGYKLFVVEF